MTINCKIQTKIERDISMLFFKQNVGLFTKEKRFFILKRREKKGTDTKTCRKVT